MSLFRVREWCSAQLGDGSEEFDFGCICVTNLLADQSKSSDQVAVGSLSGVLRLFDFGSKLPDDGQPTPANFGAVKPEQFLLEKQLEAPILQLASGHFVSGSEKIFLAVLHPRKLVVYSFKALASGKMDYSDQYDVQIAYEHQLTRISFNFICGPFGGVRDRDFFCVQSLDCTLSFYEEENFAFSRFLPGSLLPGPIIYVSKSDSFVTVSSAWQVESYKYQVLAVATDSKTKEDAANLTTGKRVAIDWSFNIGENALDLAFLDLSPAPSSILVLGERNIFCLSESGGLRFMKKLEYNPHCLLAYGSTSEGYLQYMVATDTKTLLMYTDTTLKWAAQLAHIPVCVKLLGNGPLRGMLFMVSDSGSFSCAYMGTDPAFFGIPVNDTRNVDYYQKQKEFRQLQSVIKNSNKSLNLNKSLNAKIDDLSLTCVVPSKLDDISLAYDTCVEDTVPSITVRVLLSAKVPLDNVQLFFNAPNVIVAQSNAFSFSSLIGSEEVPVTFFLKHPYVPSRLMVKVQAVYSTPGGGSKSVRSHLQLPLSLIAKMCPPQKSATYKITIDSNKGTVNLNNIFPDFSQSGNSEGAAVGFMLYGKLLPPVSILASSQTQKYRVQCDCYELIWLFLCELSNRLKSYFAASTDDFRLTYTAQLPLPEYFSLIDRHFELRKQKEKAKELMTQKSAQFRSVERQLLIKLKDDTPTPLAHLDELIEMTYRQIIGLTNAIIELDDALQSICNSLSAATFMHIYLLKIAYQLSNTEYDVLEFCFSPDVEEQFEQIWEEQVDSAITHLLTSIAKGHTSGSFAEQEMHRLADSTRFKKHVTLLCDKLAKGARLIAPDNKSKPTDNDKRKNKVNVNPTSDTNRIDVSESQLGDGDLPQGSTFGDISNPMRSLSKIAEEGEDEFFTNSTQSPFGDGDNEPTKIIEEKHKDRFKTKLNSIAEKNTSDLDEELNGDDVGNRRELTADDILNSL